MTDPMHDRCPALEPGTGERCVLYAKHTIGDRSGVHVATGSWPVEAEGTDEELTALVTDAIKVGDVARRYARMYGGDANTVHAAVEAALYVLDDRKPAADEVSTPLDSPAPADEPAPVPPPVDALLTEDLTDEALANVQHWHAIVHPDMTDRGVYEPTRNPSGCDRVFCLTIVTECAAVAAPRWWAAGVEEGRRRDDEASMQTLAERDEAQDAADRLANAVGRHLGLNVGEHSNGNDPWMVALDALAEADGGKFVKGAYEDGVAEGRRQATAELQALWPPAPPAAVAKIITRKHCRFFWEDTKVGVHPDHVWWCSELGCAGHLCAGGITGPDPLPVPDATEEQSHG